MRIFDSWRYAKYRLNAFKVCIENFKWHWFFVWNVLCNFCSVCFSFFWEEGGVGSLFVPSIWFTHSMQGLASESYIALSSEDPILRAFELGQELKRLSIIEKYFKSEYKDLAGQTFDNLCWLSQLANCLVLDYWLWYLKVILFSGFFILFLSSSICVKSNSHCKFCQWNNYDGSEILFDL